MFREVLQSDSSKLTSAKQSFYITPVNKTVLEGEDFVIPCVISDQFLIGNTFWTKSGRPLGVDYNLLGHERYSVVGDHAVGEYSLQVVNAKIEDEADYECQVLPEPGEEEGLRASAFVTVLVPPKSVKLPNMQNGGKLSAHAGSTIEIICQTDGSSPEAEIRWYKNSDIIADAKTWHKKLDSKLVSTVSQVRWPVVRSDDGSMFICQAFHPAFQGSYSLRTNVTLSAIYPPSAPEIQGYDGRTLKAGERIHLQCVVKNGNPLPEVLWYRNSKLIDRTYITNPETSVNDYEFAVDASDNVAEYKCQASNAAAFVPLSEVVRLKVFYPPESVDLSGPDSVRSGDFAQFSCHTSASHPPAKISWIVDGRPVTTATFVVRPAAENEGFYTSSEINIQISAEKREIVVLCYAANEELVGEPNGRVQKSKNVAIRFPPERITIYGYEQKPLVAGTAHRLSCVAVGGNPLATVTWYKNGRQVTRGVTNSVSDNVAQAELTFAVQPEDNVAEFSCSAENSASVKPLVAKLNATVFFGPETVVVKSVASEFRVGESAQLTCETSTSNPAPVVSWWRNGDQLNGVYVHNKSSSHNGWEVKSKLTVLISAAEDGMKYICRATNPALNRSINEATFLHVKYAPQFYLTGLQSISVLENETVVLNGSAMANPMPVTYEWTKGVKSFSSRSARPSSSSDANADRPVLNFSRISRRDAGEFQCRASNGEGTSLLVFHVQVRFPPDIYHVSDLVLARENDTADLECDVDAYPLTNTTTRWDIVPDVGNVSRFIQRVSGSKVVLHFDRVLKQDHGSYTCLANNGIGQPAKRSAFLAVRHLPVINRTLSALKVAAARNQTVTLRCVAFAVPSSTITWRRNGLQLETGSRYKIFTIERDRFQQESSLTILHTFKTDYGFYDCVARNEEGLDRHIVQLMALQTPDQPVGLKMVNFSDNSVTLSWIPQYDGGLPQTFRIRYRLNTTSSKYMYDYPGNETTYTIKNLSPLRSYSFGVEAVNKLGSKGFSDSNVVVKTLEFSSVVSRTAVKEELPLILIILLSLVGLALIALNIVLVFCFIRRHRMKKLREKATKTRLADLGRRKGSDYYSSNHNLGNGNTYASSNEKIAFRPVSDVSEDNISVRTVIEVDSKDPVIFPNGRMLGSRDRVTSESMMYYDDTDNTLYTHSFQPDVFQRYMENGGYATSVLPEFPSVSMTQSLISPSRTTSNDGGNYASRDGYTSSTLRNGMLPRYSPNQPTPPFPVETVVNSTIRSPYAEVRPILSTPNPYINVDSLAAASLSTFTPTSKLELVGLDGLSGDIV